MVFTIKIVSYGAYSLALTVIHNLQSLSPGLFQYNGNRFLCLFPKQM